MNGGIIEQSFLTSEKLLKDSNPSDFQLFPSYPNPFNSATSIRLFLQDADRLKITVINGLGRTVKELIDKQVDRGYFSCNWDGTNDDGLSMPSGIYYISVQYRNMNRYSKVLLLK